MLGSWSILQELVHLVISDNASNMVKAFQDATLAHFSCFAYSVATACYEGGIIV